VYTALFFKNSLHLRLAYLMKIMYMTSILSPDKNQNAERENFSILRM